MKINARTIILFVIGLFVAILIMRFFPFMRFILLFLLFVISTLFIISGLTSGFFNAQFQRKRKGTTIGRIENRIASIKELQANNEEEIQEVKKNIIEIEKDKKLNDEKLFNKNWKDLHELLSGFKAELDLRKSKATFFQQCLDKLTQLLDNHKIQQSIEEKKKKLQELQDEHYESLSELENLKSDVETDVFYIRF